MAEAGGTSTQSGILYQNTWAALYLGRLLDPRPRSANEAVISVRVEAPNAVDDIVVTHTDGSQIFIQAKESLPTSGVIWSKLWNSFADQHETAKEECDRLVLAIGSWTNEIAILREICHRARGKISTNEWWSSLAKNHKKIAQKIIDALHVPSRDTVFAIAALTDVWVSTLEQLEEEKVPNFVPPSSIKSKMLFHVLRDMVGGMARVRATFFQADLLDRLQLENDISLHETPNWGLDRYRKSIKQLYGTLSVPGTDVSGPIDDMFLWLPLYNRTGEEKHRDFEEEDLRWRNKNIGRTFDLRSFPRNEPRRAIIDASAGFGKTTLLYAITHKLACDSVLVPAIISLDAMAEEKLPVHDYLNGTLNDAFGVGLDWMRLCEGGRAVIFFDGLDELSDSDRSWVVGTIALFEARFPHVSWLLTVRDGSALPKPLNAQRLDIDRLDNELVAALANSYQAGGASIPVERLMRHMEHHPDLAHLLRIPLFLALVLATVKPEDDLPSSRADLLETYLTILFAPERYKQMKNIGEEIDDLRDAAEYLAF